MLLSSACRRRIVDGLDISLIYLLICYVVFETPFKVAVTCVRVPVLRAHCESINLEFERKVTLDEIYEVRAVLS
jgi:aspartate-semialdehyde dehydrogenase